MWWSHFSKLKPLRVSRKWWSHFSMLKTLRVLRKCWSHFSVLKTLRQWRSPFFSIKNFKSCKKVTESFFTGHVSLSFHMTHKFLGTTDSEATVPSFPSCSFSEHFRKYRWNSPYVSNDCLWKLCLYMDFFCLLIQSIN